MNSRMKAGIIDFLIVAIIQSILMFIFVITPIMNKQVVEDQFLFLNLKITFISITYMLIRDILGGKSIGKKFFKLKIINLNNRKEAGMTNRLLRNVTWVLGPIEIVLLLINGKRIGDWISGTQVVKENKEFV